MSDETTRTEELRMAHDVLAPVYRERLAGLLEQMPIERHLLALFGELVRATGQPAVGDVGCGTGRLLPHLAGLGLQPSGVDLSEQMVATARADHPDFEVRVADLRDLPWATATLGGVVCWYSLMYLAPQTRPAAFAELGRVVAPGGYLITAFKAGDGAWRRGGRSLDLFDIWWHRPEQLCAELVAAGFESVLAAQRPADPDEVQDQGYLLLRRDDRAG